MRMMLATDLLADKPVRDLAFDLSLRTPDGREFALRQNTFAGPGAAFPAGADTWELIEGEVDPAAFVAGRADIILRPSPNRALKTTNMSAIWSGEIMLKNIPITLARGDH